jgi:hypothetical protein
LVLDPDSGVLARYKKETDYPLNPKYIFLSQQISDLISLESINDIRLSKDMWFQDDRYIYIEISYLSKRIYIALKYKAAAR